ncbi:MAG: hypothetical protein VZR73_10590, partial [Acutalibacteraceae bacterium]|nr:hypothetical protein [Acutalibacteraceae bacterium]
MQLIADILSFQLVTVRAGDNAEALLAAGQYEEAISAFEALNGYKDSAERPLQIQYTIAEQLLESGKAQEALAAFEDIRGYKDSDAKIKEITASILDQGVAEAEAMMAAGEYDKAIE